MVAAEDGQLGAAQNGAVTAHGGQSAVDLGKFLPAAPLPPFDLLVDDGHDQTLDSGLRTGGLNAEGGALLLIQAGADGAVGGKDGGAALPLGHQGPGGLPDHVEDGDADLLLDAVHEVVGGVAGDGDDGAAALLQQAGVGQQALVHRLGVPGEDGGGPVRDPGVRQDQGGQMLLVAGGLCPVQHVLIEHLGGLGPHPTQHAQLGLPGLSGALGAAGLDS